MRFILVLSLFLAVTTAAPSNQTAATTRPPTEATTTGNGSTPSSTTAESKVNRKEWSKEDREKLLANCQKRSDKCKGQTDEYKKERVTVKAFLVEHMITHTNITEHEAASQAEVRLIKIQELKKKLHAKRGLSDIEPADNGLWQEDIVLTEEQIDAIHESLDNPRKIAASPEEITKPKRSAATFFEKKPGARWKLPIHYWVSNSFSSTEKTIIDSTLRNISQMTGCIKFAKDSTRLTTGSQIQYLKIGSNGCSGNSFIGHIGIQAINLATTGWCTGDILKGLVLHETIHALGGGHEQSRTDRDEYIDILWSNINPQKWSQYEIDPWSTSYGARYDYKSVMHYQQGAFAIAPGLKTMKPHVNTQLHSDYMTANDVLQLKRMYCKPSTCVDTYQDCGTWAIKGFCKNAIWSVWMKLKCSRSCDACQSVQQAI